MGHMGNTHKCPTSLSFGDYPHLTVNKMENENTKITNYHIRFFNILFCLLMKNPPPQCSGVESGWLGILGVFLAHMQGVAYCTKPLLLTILLSARWKLKDWHLRKVLYPKCRLHIAWRQLKHEFVSQHRNMHQSDQKEKACWDVLQIKVSCEEAFMLNIVSAQRGMRIDMWCRRSNRATAFTEIKFSSLWRSLWVFSCERVFSFLKDTIIFTETTHT